MNTEKKIIRDQKGNLALIEMGYMAAVVFYIISIVIYHGTVERTFFLERKYSMTAIWSVWFSISIVTACVSCIFIVFLRVLILKFRTFWGRKYDVHYNFLDGFSLYYRAIFDFNGFNHWGDQFNLFNNLHSLRTRASIGHRFVTISLLLVPILFAYSIFWIPNRTPVIILRFIIFNIHLVFIFTMGVINILHGIEPEIKRRFALWQMTEDKSAMLLSVNIDGGCCEINGEIYAIKLQRNKFKRVEKLYIDKSTNDQEIYIYI